MNQTIKYSYAGRNREAFAAKERFAVEMVETKTEQKATLG